MLLYLLFRVFPTSSNQKLHTHMHRYMCVYVWGVLSRVGYFTDCLRLGFGVCCLLSDVWSRVIATHLLFLALNLVNAVARSHCGPLTITVDRLECLFLCTRHAACSATPSLRPLAITETKDLGNELLSGLQTAAITFGWSV